MKPTRDEILAEPAGRQMDALVAEKVMNWQGYHDIHTCEDNWYNYCRNCGKTGADDNEKIFSWEYGDAPLPGCKGHPYYSTEIAAAFEVVAKLANIPKHEWYIETNYYPTDNSFMYWVMYEDGCQEFDAIYEDKSLPLAICKVALLTLEPFDPTLQSPDAGAPDAEG